MPKKYYLLSAVLGLFITTLSVSALASAADGGWFKARGHLTAEQQEKREEKMQQHQAAFQAKKAELDTIIANNDFDAWVALMSQRGVDESKLTQENFQVFKQIHQLLAEGQAKFEQARVLAESIGLDHFAPGPGIRFGHFRMMHHATSTD